VDLQDIEATLRENRYGREVDSFAGFDSCCVKQRLYWGCPREDADRPTHLLYEDRIGRRPLQTVCFTDIFRIIDMRTSRSHQLLFDVDAS
jgi:hypothetical protein